ncbi:hypothetical protein E4V42_01630 [Clostridium estertheticum]|uniref:Uncharacterized protein n=1 Tax=Clostridium estertheticum TaxID=238834 RepID=A0A5N7IIL0_9CLOT|nr:hypothetical protein [Clostridium estertheticum]MPQ30139.1 hypothetical protein [Clostridium estertheticum]MPQ60815.1 hypothetical protein [Clostridium estertheticum]
MIYINLNKKKKIGTSIDINSFININTSTIKKILIICLIMMLTASSYGCSKAAKSSSNNVTTTSLNQELKQKAKVYKNEEYQNGKVPLQTYIKMEGKIIQTDNKNKQIVTKSDRFILDNNGTKYQMICGQKITVKVGDKVTVYGTYYGLVQVDEIDVIMN